MSHHYTSTDVDWQTPLVAVIIAIVIILIFKNSGIERFNTSGADNRMSAESSQISGTNYQYYNLKDDSKSKGQSFNALYDAQMAKAHAGVSTLAAPKVDPSTVDIGPQLLSLSQGVVAQRERMTQIDTWDQATDIDHSSKTSHEPEIPDQVLQHFL